VDNCRAGQLEAAAAGAELDELELDSLLALDADFSDDDEEEDDDDDSELLAESPFEPLVDSRLSVR
jgi:hypothetical protein